MHNMGLKISHYGDFRATVEISSTRNLHVQLSVGKLQLPQLFNRRTPLTTLRMLLHAGDATVDAGSDRRRKSSVFVI